MTNRTRDAVPATHAPTPRIDGAQWQDAPPENLSSNLTASTTPNANTDMRAAWQAAVALHLPVAFWRQPRTTTASAIVSLAPPCQQAPNFLSRAPGFYLAPFRESSAPFFLPADIRLTFLPDGADVSFARAETETEASRQTTAAWSAAFAAACATDRAADGAPFLAKWYVPKSDSAHAPIAQHDYERLVNDAIDFIRQRNIAKVVLSRTVNAALPAEFDPVLLFDALCKRYAHAFVSLVAVPGVGTWIGASPELLLASDATTLRTMALAGTQPRPDTTIDPASVRWGEKEIVEQELVSRYVRTFFEDAGYPGFTEQGPQTVTAGKVFHLQTSFSIALPEADRLQLANQVLGKLHPTSAVCGMPRSEALSFIVEREGYDRSFYSGFLGPVFLDDRSTLYVNLRCMQLFGNSATLYVGGGITAESNPEAEWHETVVKSQTILAVLGSAGGEEQSPAPADPAHTDPAHTTSQPPPPARRRDEHTRTAPTVPAPTVPTRAAQRHPSSQTHLVTAP